MDSARLKGTVHFARFHRAMIENIPRQNFKTSPELNTILGVRWTVHRAQIRSKEVERNEGFVVNCVTLSKPTVPKSISLSRANYLFSVKNQLVVVYKS